MKPRAIIASLAVAVVLGFGAAPSWAQPTPTQEAQAQLKADQAALARARAQVARDQAALQRDRAAGGMSAESADAMRVAEDRQRIRGIQKDLAADPKGSMQAREDQQLLDDARAGLQVDQQLEAINARRGLIEATSPDAQRVAEDQQAVKAQQQAIAADRAALRANTPAR